MSDNLWNLPEDALRDLTPVKARDLIVQCFFQAQKETFARAKEKLNAEINDQSLKESIVTAIQMTFKKVNGDYQAPDKGSLEKVVSELAVKAQAWGTPLDIIEHHKKQILKVLNAL